jgi:glycosyltransferase involved in cell wall biosynthesis
LSKKKFKILFLVTEDYYFWSHRLPIACAARDAGFEVIVATRVQNYAKRIIQEGFKLIPIGLRRHRKNPLKEIISIIELIKIYRTEHPDIVHHVAMKPVLYGTTAARIAKIPIIINALAGLGYVFISDRSRANILRFLISVAFRLTLNSQNTKLIIQNPDDFEFLVTSGLVKPDNVTLIKGSGVDTCEFVPAPEHEGEPIILLVSRMLWDKGVKEFVDSAKLLVEGGTRARFVLIGRNDPANPTSIPTSTLESWQNQNYVEWWGYREDIPAVLQKSHVVCLPSYREGLPKVLIEAAACGRPIVTTDTPGCREIVKDGENGFCVPIRDANALAKAIRRLIDDPVLRKKMGKRGREIALKEFSVDKIISETLALYKKLLSEKLRN